MGIVSSNGRAVAVFPFGSGHALGRRADRSIGGRTLASIKQPSRTLLVMEWTAHAPLSWHSSLTRSANTPFYKDAQSVVGFVDGHVAYVKIYYDGINAAYTRDPVPGYDYQYSGD